MGGSNQSIFPLGAIFASQGSAAVPLLIVGLVLSWMALPGWIAAVPAAELETRLAMPSTAFVAHA